MSSWRRKLVIVGDGFCGKTSILTVYATGEFPSGYIPTVFDTFVAKLELNNQTINLSMWDTAGQEDYERLRPLSYPGTHVFLICFSIGDPVSFENIASKWLPEIRHFCPSSPFVLVGNKLDLRTDPRTVKELSQHLLAPISTDEGQTLAYRKGAERYMECSAKTGEGIKELFEQSARIALNGKRPKKHKCNLL